MGFFDRRLLIVTGKGGVGKSSVAAAMALRCAGNGLKTLLVELNAPERTPPLVGEDPAGPQIRQVRPGLWTVNIRPQDALREYVLMTLKYQAIYRAVFENRVVRTFIRLLPSVQELVMLGKVIYHLREKEPNGAPRFDRIVLDAPATGHALSLLSVPQVLLDTVPPGPLAHEAKVMRDILIDPAVTAAALVALPEEMPVVETLELNRALRQKTGIEPAAILLNRYVPARFTAEELSGLAAAHAPMLPLARAQVARSRRSEEALRRLEAATGRIVCPLPQLWEEPWGASAAAKLSEALTPLERS